MLRILTAAVILLAVGGTVTGFAAREGTTQQVTKSKPKAKKAERCESARKATSWYRQRTHDWQARRGAELADRSPTIRGRSCRWVKYAVETWMDRSAAARKAHERWVAEQRRLRRLLYEKWRCIHEHEGAWDAINPAGYYGGLQMDIGFQSTYGSEFMARWGYAHRWPVWAQLTAAERAYHGYGPHEGRGFGPWPNTRRMCGI